MKSSELVAGEHSGLLFVPTGSAPRRARGVRTTTVCLYAPAFPHMLASAVRAPLPLQASFATGALILNFANAPVHIGLMYRL